MKWLAYPVATVLSLCLSGTTDAASQQGRNVAANWRAADKCAKEAQAAHPDYSAESNAKRDASLNECLRLYNLTPREPLSQPSR
jgi:hypothetical protein